MEENNSSSSTAIDCYKKCIIIIAVWNCLQEADINISVNTQRLHHFMVIKIKQENDRYSNILAL